jgi:hypothetical protein
MGSEQKYFSLAPTKKNIHRDETLHPREKSGLVPADRK